MAERMLTTTDNPYNPFNNFDKWYAYDVLLARQQGRPNVCSYLARMARVSSRLPDKLYDKAVDSAIEEIVDRNITGKYKAVTEEEAKTLL